MLNIKSCFIWLYYWMIILLIYRKSHFFKQWLILENRYRLKTGNMLAWLSLSNVLSHSLISYPLWDDKMIIFYFFCTFSLDYCFVLYRVKKILNHVVLKLFPIWKFEFIAVCIKVILWNKYALFQYTIL